MTTPLQANLQAAISSFAADVTDIIAASVADATRDVLGSVKSGARGKTLGTKTTKTTKASNRSAVGRSVSIDAVLAAVQKKPGLRMEQLGVALGAKTARIKAPMKELIAKKKVKTSGKARGTTYRAA